MKLECQCGWIIRDNSDDLSYRACFIADQDYQYMMDGIIEQVGVLLEKARADTQADIDSLLKSDSLRFWKAAAKYTARTMYQCEACGRLYVDDIYQSRWMHGFKPEADTQSGYHLLRSVDGDTRKRMLRGRWWKNPVTGIGQGELWWTGIPTET